MNHLYALIFHLFFIYVSGMDVYEEKKLVLNTQNTFFISLISGGLAGTCVDIALFPIDTLKTRLQSEHGFIRSGGISQLYRGLSPVLMGSAPTAAVFFVTYDTLKRIVVPKAPVDYLPFVHMGAASFSELVACLIRVPVEVIKQRKQAFIIDQGRFNIGLLYRGYWSTVLRDMPFSLIQFPIWEYLKKVWSDYVQRNIFPIEGAVCGAVAGSIAAALTTPLDVAKTRIMLFDQKTYDSSKFNVSSILKTVYKDKGISGLFAGIVPRVMWISVGGFIFFGVYEKSSSMLSSFS